MTWLFVLTYIWAGITTALFIFDNTKSVIAWRMCAAGIFWPCISIVIGFYVIQDLMDRRFP
jgi:hypothetical protein